jgi:hypothetical protein
MFADGDERSNALSSPDHRQSPSVDSAVGEWKVQRFARVQPNGNLIFINWCVVVGFTSFCFRAINGTIHMTRAEAHTMALRILASARPMIITKDLHQ